MMKENRKKFFRGMETYVIGILGALLFSWANVPLAWMLGSLTAVMCYHLYTKRKLHSPFSFRQIAFVLMGYMLGTSFTKETAVQIAVQLPFMLISTLAIIGVSLLLGVVVAKKCGISMETSVFGSVPGGLSQMVLISEEVGKVDVSVVTLMQTIRLLCVIFIVPFLTLHGLANGISQSAGATPVLAAYSWTDYLVYGIVAVSGGLLGWRIKLPAGVLTGPLLATAIFSILTGKTAPEIPHIFIVCSQLIFGAYIGLMMNINSFAQVRKLLIYNVLSGTMLVLCALFVGWVLSSLTFSTVATSFLSMAPGGIAEMGITATSVHADLSLVGSYQMFRLFFIMFAIPPLLKWWIKARMNKKDVSPT